MKPRFDIANLLRHSGRRRRRTIVVRTREPAGGLILEARKIGLDVVASWRAVAINLLDAYEAARQARAAFTPDAAGDDLAVLIEREFREQRGLLVRIEPLLASWAARVEVWQRKSFAAAIRNSTGLDLYALLSQADVEDAVAASLERHAGLVRGMSADAERRISETIWREFIRDTPRNAIGKMLAAELDISRNRANFIAKDQTIKLGATLNEERQQQAGITQYMWRTAEDDRVRPTHAIRDGKVYDWNDSGIKPGEEPNCRCTAQAYIELLDQV